MDLSNSLVFALLLMSADHDDIAVIDPQLSVRENLLSQQSSPTSIHPMNVPSKHWLLLIYLSQDGNILVYDEDNRTHDESHFRQIAVKLYPQRAEWMVRYRKVCHSCET